MTANDPSRHHYRVSGLTALFVRQPDRTLLPYNPEAGADTDDDEEIGEETAAGEEAALEQSADSFWKLTWRSSWSETGSRSAGDGRWRSGLARTASLGINS
jgi:hypothetical protein